MSECPSDAELSALVEGTLPPADRERVQAHVADCRDCAQLMALLLKADVQPEQAKPGSSVAPPSALADRYDVRRALGQGAMGEVFVAYDRKLERAVALKWLRPTEAVDGKRVRHGQALSEAKALAKIGHPNVVHVYDVLELDGEDVIAMEYVEGVTLREWLAAAPRSAGQVRARFGECAAGLGAAHAAGLVHRDFKPDNVLLGKDEVARVVDFGLSKDTGLSQARLDSADGLTTIGSAGTPRYMAPEVLRGQPADARSDQFSWGVALYEALTGEQPFPSVELPARIAAMEQRAFTASPRFQALPRTLRATLERALAPERTARFESMEAAAAALQPRAPWRGAPAVVLAVALVVGGVGAWYRHAHQCDGVADGLDATWSPARREAVLGALRAVPLPYAEATATRAGAFLDGWASGWRSAATQVCRAGRITRTEPPALEAARHLCLQRAAGQLGAQLEAFARLPPDRLGVVLTALAQLPTPADCVTTTRLLDTPPRPVAPDAQATLIELEGQLDGLLAEVNTGLYADAAKRCEAALPRARTLGFGPLTAGFAAQCGRQATAQGQVDQARALLQEAMQVALSANAWALALTAATLATRNEGLLASAYTTADAWRAVGEGLASRPPLDRSVERAELLSALGDVADVRGYARDAATNRQAALRLVEALGRGDSADAALLRCELGQALAGAGQEKEALEVAALGAKQLLDALGQTHPLTIRGRSAYAVTLVRARRFDEAFALYEDELALKRGLYGDGHHRVVNTLINTAEAGLNAGRFDVALAGAREGLLRIVGRGPDDFVRLILAQKEHEALLELARWDEACAGTDELLTRIRAGKLSDEALARMEWIVARCAHHRAPDDAGLRATAARLRPMLPSDAMLAIRTMDAVLAAPR